MLEMKNVTKTFGEFKALDDLSMAVPKGAVYGLVGPNGAGKTTAIRHMTGVYRPDAGEITLDGQKIDENLPVKEKLCLVADDPFYFPGASLQDMANFYAGIYPRFDRQRFEELQEVFHLPRKSPIRRFSKGMQKQAAFHLALCTHAEYLILDEPLDGLDPVMRRQVLGLILDDVARRSTSVLVSSHNLRELEDICDHVGIMKKGKMLVQRSLADMQGSTVKLQMVGNAPKELEILHKASSGRLNTYIVRGSIPKVQAAVERQEPAYFDILPLSLEEIFIYELGGAEHETEGLLL